MTLRSWPTIDPTLPLSRQLDRLSDQLRLYRDRRCEPGSDASYRLTGHFAQLSAVAGMLRRSPAEQCDLARFLLDDSLTYLRGLQGDYDA